MIVYVRHSDDEGGDCSKAHDCRLTRRGISLASTVGSKLIEKYGIPNIVYVSPFRRTIQTVNAMLRSVDTTNIEVIEDVRIGRYFSSREQRHPDIDPQTDVTGLHVEESYTQFKHRVRRFARFMKQFVASDQVAWVVTHALVYKQLAYYYSRDIPSHIPFMHNFRIGRRIQPTIAKITHANEERDARRVVGCPRCGKRI